MPELFVLQPTIHNRRSNGVRSPPVLARTDNTVRRQLSKNSFREITEIYYVPDDHDYGPAPPRPPLQVQPPSPRNDSPMSPEVPYAYPAPNPGGTKKASPGKKIYYRPLRYEPKRLAQPHKPLTPPVRRNVPPPQPPPPPVLKRPVQTPPLTMTRASPRPPLSVRIATPPVPSTNRYPPATLGAPELYHLNNGAPVSNPYPTNPTYRSPSPTLRRPPPSGAQSVKPLPPSILKRRSPLTVGTELYHLGSPEPPHAPVYHEPVRSEPVYPPVHHEPVRTEQPYRSPAPQKRISTPPASPPLKTFHPAPTTGPELYHLNEREVYTQPSPEVPRIVEPQYKPPAPSARPVAQPIPPPTPPPVRATLVPTSTSRQPPVIAETRRFDEPPRPSAPPTRVTAPPPPPPPTVIAPPPPTRNDPEMFHLSAVEPTSTPVPVEPRRFAEPYKPVTAPITNAPPVVNSTAPELFHLRAKTPTQPPIFEEPKPAPPPPKPVPQPSARVTAPPPVVVATPTRPIEVTPPPTRREPELFHLTDAAPVVSAPPTEPKRVEQPYRPVPPAPIPTVSPTPVIYEPKPDAPHRGAPELYHMVFDETALKPLDQSTHSPLPSSIKPASLPISEPVPPPLEKPEFYHLHLDNVTPPPTQPRQLPTSSVPATTRRVSPTPAELPSQRNPEMYHMLTEERQPVRPPPSPEVVKPKEVIPPKAVTPYVPVTKPPVARQRTPPPPPRQRTPSPPRQRTPSPLRMREAPPLAKPSPVARAMRTAAPLAMPTRKPAPVYDDDDDDDQALPNRRPSFSTNLQNVLLADRVVPLSESKASGSIKRSMNKFRYNDD